MPLAPCYKALVNKKPQTVNHGSMIQGFDEIRFAWNPQEVCKETDLGIRVQGFGFRD